MSRRGRGPARRGSALVAVLWLSAALSAIAFTVAATVRTEVQRAGDSLDAARAYHLAAGAIERFVIHLAYPSWGQFTPGQRRLRWEFPSGVVDLEITGEGGKLGVYRASREALIRLLLQLGAEPGRAEAVAADILARRQGSPTPAVLGPSFSSRMPSFLQLEDLLSVRGMTPELYYGWWDRTEEGRLVERGGVARHLTLLEDAGINANYASQQVLRAVGVPEDVLAMLIGAREGRILQDAGQLAPLGLGVALPGGAFLSAGGSAAYTVRATAQLRGRPARRTVAALIRSNPAEAPVGVVRWYPLAQ